MANEEKKHSRYPWNRGVKTLWNGDSAEKDSQFVEIIITSEQPVSNEGTFQVCALEGVGLGIENGKLAVDKEKTKVLFDEDLQGYEAAEKKMNELAGNAQNSGFKTITDIDVMEFEAKKQKS